MRPFYQDGHAGHATLDGTEGAAAAEKAAMRFFKVSARRDGSPHLAARSASGPYRKRLAPPGGARGARALPQRARCPLSQLRARRPATPTSATLSLRVGGLLQRAQGSDA